MTCFHITQIKEEINNFARKINDDSYNSTVHEKLDSMVKKEDIKSEVRVKREGWFSNDYEAVTTYAIRDLHCVSKEALLELLKKISDLSNSCECREDLRKGKDNEIKKVNDENDNLKKQLVKINNDEIKAKDNRISDLRVESKGYKVQVEGLEKTKKEVKDDLDLKRKDFLEKAKELERKEAEITFLKEQLTRFKTKELEGNFDLAEKELNSIVKRFEIEKKYARKLRGSYEQLIYSKKNDNKTEINNIKEKIFEIEDELEKKIADENVREFSKQCEKAEELKFQLDQLQRQQFEARQEYSRPS